MPEYIVEANTLDELVNGIYAVGNELVRCRECGHYGKAWLKSDGTDDKRYKDSVCLCGKYAVAHDPDWYCSDAERREE